MIDPLVEFLQRQRRVTFALARCTIATSDPLTIVLPTGATVPAEQITGLTYTTGRGVLAALTDGQIALAIPVGAAFTAPPAAAEPPTPADPVADIALTVTDLAVTVDGTGSTASVGTSITSWAWTYGDGTAVTGPTPGAHTYPRAGTYTVALTVTDSRGRTGSSSQNVTVAAPPAAPTQPTGDGTVRYQDLPGSSLQKKLEQIPNSKRMTLPVGTITVNDFDAEGLYGFLTDNAGILGAGPASSIIRLAPNSSSRAGNVPTSKGTTTNPLYVGRFVRGSGIRLDGFAIVGTGQGHLYNGIRVNQSAGPQLSNLLVRHIPGNSDINPGETFFINLWHCTAIRMAAVEIDGDDVGASGLGLNTCHGGFTIDDLNTHDLKWCKGAALWEQSGGGTFNRFRSVNNAFGLGFERCDGTYTLNEPTFRGSDRADIHLANDGGQWGRAHLVINDPDLKDGQRIKVLLSRTELGRPNKQTRDDVRVYVKGKNRTADLVQFVTAA